MAALAYRDAAEKVLYGVGEDAPVYRLDGPKIPDRMREALRTCHPSDPVQRVQNREPSRAAEAEIDGEDSRAN